MASAGSAGAGGGATLGAGGSAAGAIFTAAAAAAGGGGGGVFTAAGPAGVLCGRSDREVELGDLIGGVEGGLALCRVSCCSILSIAAYFTIKLSNCSFVGCPLGTGATGGRFGLAAKDGGGLGTAGFLHMAFGGSMGSSSESKDGGLTATFGGLGSSSESMSIMSTV